MVHLLRDQNESFFPVGAAAQPPRAQRDCGQILTFILDFATAKAIRASLKLPAQEPEPLAHAPPQTVEFVAESAKPVPASTMPGARAPAARFKRLTVGP